MIPNYPDFTALSLELRKELHPKLKLKNSDPSDYSFSNLYLFRDHYQYKTALGPGGEIIMSGKNPDDGVSFFLTPSGFPGFDILKSLFNTHDYWKNISPALLESTVEGVILSEQLEKLGITVSEDRNNFDYLYNRTDLAALSGKRFHKKKNLVNAFKKTWPNHKGQPLIPPLIPDAIAVLDQWKQDKGEDGDYVSAKEAIEQFTELELQGAVYYIDEKPVAYCLGEIMGAGTVFIIKFEKAMDQYKGVYQYINQAFASDLPETITYINREQDLGDEGLRQAKMTYRPVDFVQKYRGTMRG